jgi:hypothetical protein
VAEWTLLLLLILVVFLLFARQVNLIRGQAELSAIQSTLGALRTALVLDQVQRSVQGSVQGGASTVASGQRNPFDLLQARPLNYRGAFQAQSLAALAPGSWVFDSDCPCVGYLPMDGQWLHSPNGDVMLWYQLKGAGSVMQLDAREHYLWQGLAVE